MATMAGRRYHIKLIPTQIFFSPEGKELFRHQGFFPEAEIISQWQQLGYHLEQQKSIGPAAGKPGRLASLFSSLGQAVAGTPAIALLAAFLLGLIFGIALGPCTFAYMAPMLAITFKTAVTHTMYAVALLLAYGLGHCSVIVLAGTFTEILQSYLNWNEKSQGTQILKKTCAFLVLLGGLYLIYKT